MNRFSKTKHERDLRARLHFIQLKKKSVVFFFVPFRKEGIDFMKIFYIRFFFVGSLSFVNPRTENTCLFVCMMTVCLGITSYQNANVKKSE